MMPPSDAAVATAEAMVPPSQEGTESWQRPGGFGVEPEVGAAAATAAAMQSSPTATPEELAAAKSLLAAEQELAALQAKSIARKNFEKRR